MVKRQKGDNLLFLIEFEFLWGFCVFVVESLKYKNYFVILHVASKLYES